ncbi:N-acetyl-1-D-myo-inositol-2-amino-2-deoxy-alpha-D-glucopyranoside deacetylase [Actinospica robiniae]|uniref:N-acetyl-1-D-myo-inositol-2-amino-2-deoxy-alpha- D-glucopyranoside deacetylase n=1 Tax=Actinospica robiniae TaxID=304901 RepID=UPI0004081D2D|nr:N-acetyl-1-D-myo-inositol-2-amino-2-deoxy-alpha-D-glucopyranoside deacetylase [Actinospica robiniae]
MPTEARSILFVHAHPDDESINNGATMAKYVAEGARVTLVTCTRGEYGEILLPELAHLAADREDRLGEYRVGELDRAMARLGVRDHRFLGEPGEFHDSGMMGTEGNERADAFWQADVGQTAQRLAEVIREVRPQVLVTYNPFGGYGHPDHIQAHRVAMRAVELVEGTDAQVERVYWNTMPYSVLVDAVGTLREEGADTGFKVVEAVEELLYAEDDSLVSAVIHAEEHVPAKTEAMREHATQILVDGPFFALSNYVGMRVLGTEYYRLARGSAPTGAPVAVDLFAGLDR